MAIDLNDAAVFVKVVQAGSFSAAARLLGLPASTVSTRVARLEQRLGVTLLQRTTRRLHLTDAGRTYLEPAAAGLAQLSQAELKVSSFSAEVTGVLRVTAPADIGDTMLASLVQGMQRMYPQLGVELLLLDRHVDLVAEGVDVAIRTGELRDSSLIARRVGTVVWALFASAAYLAEAPPLTRPAHLEKHRCLQFSRMGAAAWTLSKAGKQIRVAMAGQVLANDIGVVRALAVAGEGVALLPTYLCREEAVDSPLQRVLPGWQASADPVSLVYPRQQFVAPKLRAFLDLAVVELGHWLD